MPPKRHNLSRKFKSNARKDKHKSVPDSDKSVPDSGTASFPPTSISTNTSSSSTVAEQIVVQTDGEEEEENGVPVDYIIDDMVVERGDPLLEDISRAKRMTIAYLFIVVHGAPLDTNLWTEYKGITYKIHQALSLPRQSDIRRYLDDIMEAQNNGTTYKGDQHIHPNTGPLLGRQALI
jgi:hypothetical protein